MSKMVMVRAGDQQNVFVALGMSRVAEVVTALAIQHMTILGIVIGHDTKPKITLQFNAHLRETLGADMATATLCREAGLVTRCKEVGGCLLEWQEPDLVH
jgi:hypothetical protein